MLHNIELIAYAVRKGIERDLHFEVSLTYPPTSSSMGQSAGYTSVISLSQRVEADNSIFLRTDITDHNKNRSVKNVETIYIYYRNKITRAKQKPELSSIEIGIFDQGKFLQLSKFHVAGLDDSAIVKQIKEVIRKKVFVL